MPDSILVEAHPIEESGSNVSTLGENRVEWTITHDPLFFGLSTSWSHQLECRGLHVIWKIMRTFQHQNYIQYNKMLSLWQSKGKLGEPEALRVPFHAYMVTHVHWGRAWVEWLHYLQVKLLWLFAVSISLLRSGLCQVKPLSFLIFISSVIRSTQAECGLDALRTCYLKEWQKSPRTLQDSDKAPHLPSLIPPGPTASLPPSALRSPG